MMMQQMQGGMRQQHFVQNGVAKVIQYGQINLDNNTTQQVSQAIEALKSDAGKGLE